ncbi:MAG TPA: hypothetical protein VFN10_15050 [Thermoanaerobaculia bacterium]|nr:hypothetical protein [Thermoanaerobaculia bacterium]
MATTTITKEYENNSVYLHRVSLNDDGSVRSDERVKADPIFAFTQPASANLDPATGMASISVRLTLTDFDGAPRYDSGTAQVRLTDRGNVSDEGFEFACPVDAGVLTVHLDVAIAGDYTLSLVPPFLADSRLAEAVRIRVTS